MTSSDLNKMLVTKLPFLAGKYNDEVSWQEGDDTGSHVIYGDVLTPYLRDCMTDDKEKEVQTVFDFLEELLGLEDTYAEEVVWFSVLESLAYLFEEKGHFTSLLGEKCKRALNEVR